MTQPPSYTILVADDNEFGRYAVCRILHHAGFGTNEAATGAEALEKSKERPDLIMLDINLPDICGLEVCRRLKADPTTSLIPVLQTSAILISTEAKVQALENGADGFITGAAEPVELIAQVRSLIRLKDALKRLQEMSRIKDEFLATVSHELRTPLTAILGWTRLLRAGNLDDATANRGLDTIERNVRSQSQLIEDLLDISRIITGKLRFDMQPVDVTQLIHSAVDTLMPAAVAKGVKTQLQFDAKPLFVSGDAERLKQVVWNLLSNAIKFTAGGGLIEIGIEEVGAHIEITVTDNGEGIATDFLPYVFERFRQADGTIANKHGGLGLGLAIARNLVELHGGTIRVHSEGLGKGATFKIALPVRKVNSGLPDKTGQPLSSGRFNDEIGLTGIGLLVVDDEADTCELVSLVCTQVGMKVRIAGSVAEALQILEIWTPEILITDIGMPVEDGYQFIRKVRAHPSQEIAKMPIIALTAFAGDLDRVRILAAGFQFYLPKPFEPDKLLSTIASLTNKLKNRRQA